MPVVQDYACYDISSGGGAGMVKYDARHTRLDATFWSTVAILFSTV
jgi:hypothetical protein